MWMVTITELGARLQVQYACEDERELVYFNISHRCMRRGGGRGHCAPPPPIFPKYSYFGKIRTKLRLKFGQISGNTMYFCQNICPVVTCISDSEFGKECCPPQKKKIKRFHVPICILPVVYNFIFISSFSITVFEHIARFGLYLFPSLLVCLFVHSF